MEDVTKPSDLVSHAEPEPWCSLPVLWEKGVFTSVLLLPATGRGNPASQTLTPSFPHKGYSSPDLSALESDRPEFESWFYHLFSL